MLAPLVSGAINDKTARTNKASLTPSPAAMYSASEVDSETTRCVFVKNGKRGACEQKAATVLPNRTAAA